MRNVVFRYVDKWSDAVFQVGPIDFTLLSGDLVFITGGNGSGKSTFLKLLAAIFPDYHLFEKLYGVPDPDPAEVDSLLAQFQLHDKTHLTDGHFSTLDLSQGQRKRLALIVSLLEKRPLLLLDEWAADQDPEFRRKFYYELLPELKRSGETVVAITHDDRYIDEMD